MGQAMADRRVRTGMVRVCRSNISATWKPMLLWMATSRSGRPGLNPRAFVVVTDDTVLFDTGQTASATEADYFPAGRRRHVPADGRPDPARREAVRGPTRSGHAKGDVSRPSSSRTCTVTTSAMLAERPGADPDFHPAEWATVRPRAGAVRPAVSSHRGAPTGAGEIGGDETCSARCVVMTCLRRLSRVRTPGTPLGSGSMIVSNPETPGDPQTK